MQTLRLWRTSGTVEAALRFSTVIPSALPLPQRKHLRGEEGDGGRGGKMGSCNTWSRFQVRRRGLLRQQARAQLLEKNANPCIILSPEEKVSNRPDTYTSLFPCPENGTTPRTEHLVCLEDGNIVDIVSRSLDLPSQNASCCVCLDSYSLGKKIFYSKYVEELIHFGAIYYALVCPPPPKGSITPLQWELYKKAAALSQNKKRPSLKGKTIAEAQKTYRISNIYEGVEAGSYLRVHVHIKRFPRCYKVDWKSRVIAETESYVVLDKPAGIPVGSALDNIIECCAVFTTRALGLKDPLRLTHQIDNCTEGCVVLAKTKEFSSQFHQQLRNRQVHKNYLALAAAPVPLGLVTHYMRPGDRPPRILSPVALPGWAKCQLEVLECEEIPWPSPAVEASYHVQNTGWELKKSAYECKVKLITGRTHQVRAQFAALKAPIVGDTMYMPAALSLLKSPDAYPFAATTIDDDDNGSEVDIDEDALEKWAAIHGWEPDCTIGLKAYEISWNDGECVYKVKDPWWR